MPALGSCTTSTFVVLALVASLATHGCGPQILANNVPPVPVADLDAHGVNLARAQQLVRGDRAELVLRILGEPADRQTSCVPGEFVWRYPIRAWNDMANRRQVVPAALLRTTFDRNGSLRDWEFVDSLTGHDLSVHESSDAAESWFQSLSRSPAPVPPHIKLDERLVPGHTTEHEVESMFGQWHPDLLCSDGGPAPLLRKKYVASGTVLEWYVDRPSPLFVPPMYLVAAFDRAGTLIVWHLRQTYPGGRK
jgi:hypothetical protein